MQATSKHKDLQYMDVTCMSCLLITLSLLAIAKIIISRRHANLPPGPPSFPIIGNLHQLGAKPHKSLAKLAQIHGPIMRLKLGQVTSIVISSAAAARLVLQKQDQAFANRSVPDTMRACGHGDTSIVWRPVSPAWRELRKICHSEMFCGQKMDAYAGLREHKVGDLIAEIRKSSSLGEAVFVGELAFKTQLSLISTMILSADMADGNLNAAREFQESFRAILEGAAVPNLVDYFPWLSIFDPQRLRSRMSVHFGKLLRFINSEIDGRLAQRADQGSVFENRDDDVLDSLLNILQQGTEQITRKDINHLLLDLFVAATETTSSTVEWAMSEVLKAPEILLKVKAELQQVRGQGMAIRDADIPHLPYLRAVVKESLRLHTPAPFLVPRKTLEGVKLSGFTIPKGTQILVNAWIINRDATTWDDPECFKPDRFLNSDLDFNNGMSFELITFGGGRRICPGVPIASSMVHLMLGSLINSFDWKLADGIKPEELNMDDKFGLTLPKTQPLRAIPVNL